MVLRFSGQKCQSAIMWTIYVITTTALTAFVIYDMGTSEPTILHGAVLFYVVMSTLILWRLDGNQKPAWNDSHEEKILNLMREKKSAQRQDLLPVTRLSRSTLGRLLDEMEKKGLIEQHGDRKGARYRLK